MYKIDHISTIWKRDTKLTDFVIAQKIDYSSTFWISDTMLINFSTAQNIDRLTQNNNQNLQKEITGVSRDAL